MAKPKAATFPRFGIRKQRSEAKLQDYDPSPCPPLPAQHATISSQAMLGVVAFLDIRTEDGDDVSTDFELALIAMGAKVRKTFTDNVTHLVFKNGSTATLQRAYTKSIHVVNLLWITRSQTLGCKLDEKQFAIDRPTNLSVGLRKRRKSMEPGRVKELVLDPRRFSSSWITENPDGQQDNTKEMARLSLDDNESKPRRHTMGGIRQSVLKFAREWKRNEIKQPDNSNITSEMDISDGCQQGKDTPTPNIQSNNPYASQTVAKPAPGDQAVIQDPLPNKPTTRITTTSLPRPTIFSELQLSTSGLPYTVVGARSPRLTMRRPPPAPPRSLSHKNTTIATSPSVNSDIKSSFYFATTSQERPMKTSYNGQSPSLKRKRRSSVGPRLSLQGNERASLLNLSNDVCMQSHKHRKHDHKTIILTSMDQQSRDMCRTVLEKFGTYTIGDMVNDSTTHVIVGCKRRTMSVAFGILRGLWLVTVDWMKACAEAGHYVSEENYEIIDWYPKCTHTRQLASTGTLPGATLLKLRRIYIGKTMFDRQMVQKLTSECGATICDRSDSAALVIACEPDTNIPTVIENWLFDCIEQFEDLAIEPYILDIRKSLPPC